MDRNQVIGFVLIFLILVFWSILNQPTPEEIQQAKEKARLEQVKMENEAGQTDNIPEVLDAQESRDTAILPTEQRRVEKIETISNDLLTLNFSSKGGRLLSAELSQHDKIFRDENKEKIITPVQLFEDEKNRFNYRLDLRDQIINSEDIFFNSSTNSNTVLFSATLPNGGTIEQTYTLPENSYTIEYSINFKGLNQYLRREEAILLEVDNYLDALEENVQFEKNYSTIYFKEIEEDSDYCSCRGDDTEELEDTDVEWASFVHQFFNTSLIAKDEPFEGLVATVQMSEPKETGDLKRASVALNIPYGGSNDETFSFDMFIGPNEYPLLRSFDNGLEEIIPFGRSIFGDINRLFIRPFFDWLSQFISSKGLVIIVLIFIIKMAVYPLTYKMLHSQAKMQALKPQLAGLKEKFKDDAQKVQMETMKIYREYGVSPFGGCFPMILQIPIWYALFRFFPASITFRQEPFLWAHDLSSYDVFVNLPFEIPAFGAHLSLFTILWAITQVIYTFYNTQHMDMSANPAMKYVQYLMPIMFLAFFNSYASGLTCYMLFSTMITIGQTIITKKFVFDDEKIMEELNIKKAKPKKKNSFQARLEEAMKRQQEIQRQKQTQNKKKKS